MESTSPQVSGYSSVTVAYPELVSGGLFPSHTLKWMVKVGASKCVIRVD